MRLRRAQLVELVLLATTLAIAVNLFSSVIYDYLSPLAASGVATLALTIPLAFVTYTRLSTKQQTVTIEAGVVIDKESLAVLYTPGYEFGEEVSQIAGATFRENAALEKQWLNDPPSKSWDFDLAPGTARWRESAGTRLLKEFGEYFVLTRLGLHLSSYFNDDKQDDEVTTFTRQELPAILLSNRVLEMLSRDVADRPGFDDTPQNREVVSIFGKFYYHQLRLTLPRRSRVERHKNSLVIENQGIKISIEVDARGFMTNFPSSYFSYTLGKRLDEVSAYQVDIAVSTKVKWRLLLGRNGDRRHGWIESFLDKLIEDCDIDDFERRLNWPMIEMILRCQDMSRKRGLGTEVSQSRKVDLSLPGQIGQASSGSPN
ncbi:hypothetical protein ACWCHM_26305 [Micromonospora sp. SCSIO 07396]